MHIRYGRQFLRHRTSQAACVLLLVFAVAAIGGPLFSPDPSAETPAVLQAPSKEHLLGTNDVGQDVWARLAAGSHTSLLVGLSVGLFSTILSVAAGVPAALRGGLYDRVMMRIVDAFLVMPTIVVAVLVSAFIQPGIWGLVALISLLHWQGGARILRAQTLSLKEEAHVDAAKTFGGGTWHLLWRHILPDLTPLLIVGFVQRARMAVLMEAGLAFIGITTSSMISWGTMIRHAMDFYHLPAWQWWLLPPGICLSLLIIAFVFIGHTLEHIMEPRLNHHA